MNRSRFIVGAFFGVIFGLEMGLCLYGALPLSVTHPHGLFYSVTYPEGMTGGLWIELPAQSEDSVIDDWWCGKGAYAAVIARDAKGHPRAIGCQGKLK